MILNSLAGARLDRHIALFLKLSLLQPWKMSQHPGLSAREEPLLTLVFIRLILLALMLMQHLKKKRYSTLISKISWPCHGKETVVFTLVCLQLRKNNTCNVLLCVLKCVFVYSHTYSIYMYLAYIFMNLFI